MRTGIWGKRCRWFHWLLVKTKLLYVVFQFGYLERLASAALLYVAAFIWQIGSAGHIIEFHAQVGLYVGIIIRVHRPSLQEEKNGSCYYL